MRLSRGVFILSIAFFLLVYIGTGVVLNKYYSSDPQSRFSKLVSATGIIHGLEQLGLPNLYAFESIKLSNDSPTFLLDYSKNDLIYKDSIFNMIDAGRISILEDRWKVWRNCKIVENGLGYKVKFKLHGSSIVPYRRGFESLSVKSKMPINGRRYFKLITCDEMTYYQIFSNHFASKYGLVTEDVGDIVAVNSRGKIRDFFQYSSFDRQYLQSMYNFSQPRIIRRNTFSGGGNFWHSSNLDNVGYNLDADSISKNDYAIWEAVQKELSVQSLDLTHMGRFLALLQLFGHPHQTTGNNDKWVISDNILYPVWRQESDIVPIDKFDLINNTIFSGYYSSSSYEIYKKSLTIPKVIEVRNSMFDMIVSNRENILNRLDSIFDSHKEIHMSFNENYLLIKSRHKYSRTQLDRNIQALSKYLHHGYTNVSYDGDMLRITSSRQNKLRIEIDDKSYDYLPQNVEYHADLKKLELTQNELVISGVQEISSLIIKDVLLNEKLQIEKDYSFIVIN